MGDLIHIGFDEVEGHEQLPGSDDFGKAEFDVVDAAAAADERDGFVGFEVEAAGVVRIHFEPGVGRHAFEQGHLLGLGAGVPVFNGTAGIEDEGEAFAGLVGERFQLTGMSLALPSLVGKTPSA